MAYQINVSRDAEKDLIIAQCYYRERDLEDVYNEDFKLQLEYLKANPYLIQLYYRQVRRIHFSQFKYSIHYIIKNGIVYILRILGHKQYYK
jgi:hypothetical protein